MACVLAIGMLVLVGGTPRTSLAAERSAVTHFGLGVGALIGTVIYGTVKTVYAVGGSITGGLAYVLTGGRNDVARAIIQPAVRGDYVITPDHLAGGQTLVFAGRDPLTAPSYPE